jgi:hypothetical protein
VKGIFKKHPGGILVPDDDDTAERVVKLPVGTPLLMEFKKARNYLFLKKAHALVKLAFGYHSETMDKGVMYRGVPVRPDIERFRDDLTILAGWYTATFCVNGEVKLRAKSWAYVNMDEDDFEQLYSDLIDVVLMQIYQGQYSEAQMQRMVSTVLGFG